MTGDALVGPGRDNDPDAFRQLVQQIQDLRRYVDDRSSQILRTAGLRAEPDLLRVLGSLVVEGDLSVPSGQITLGGVAQTISQVIPGTFAASASNFTLLATATLPVTLMTVTLTAPEQTTRAVIIARMSAKATNSSDGIAWLRCEVVVNGAQASIDSGPIYNSGQFMNALTVGTANVLSSTVTVEGRADASGGSTGVENTAILSGLVIWLR